MSGKLPSLLGGFFSLLGLTRGHCEESFETPHILLNISSHPFQSDVSDDNLGISFFSKH